jgi:hypothetical protein
VNISIPKLSGRCSILTAEITFSSSLLLFKCILCRKKIGVRNTLNTPHYFLPFTLLITPVYYCKATKKLAVESNCRKNIVGRMGRIV